MNACGKYRKKSMQRCLEKQTTSNRPTAYSRIKRKPYSKRLMNSRRPMKIYVKKSSNPETTQIITCINSKNGGISCLCRMRRSFPWREMCKTLRNSSGIFIGSIRILWSGSANSTTAAKVNWVISLLKVWKSLPSKSSPFRESETHLSQKDFTALLEAKEMLRITVQSCTKNTWETRIL